MIHVLRCLHPNPVNVDILIGEPLPEGNPNLVREKVAAFKRCLGMNATTGFGKRNVVFVVMPAEKPARCAIAQSVLSITTSRVGPKAQSLLPEPTHGILFARFTSLVAAQAVALAKEHVQWTLR